MTMINKKSVKSFLISANKYWQKNWLWYSMGAILVCLLLAGYAFRQAWRPVVSVEPVVEEKVLTFRHPLTGQLLEAEISRPQVFAVMVENSADAWPLAGIDDAFLVIEAPVEAGIPRFETFFAADQTTEKIGPVRSARPYYLDWAEEFGAVYAHVGGSPDALNLIAAGDLWDLNEFWNGQYFWRSPNRYAPHNTYTSTELLNKVLTAKKATAPEFNYGLWTFKDDSPTENPSDSDLNLEAGSLAYGLSWKYDQEKNNYLRWQGSVEDKVEDGDKIYANNVAVVYTAISVIDSVGRREIETIGEGEALVLQDGKKIPAVWKKESANDRLRFFSEDGKEIKWNAGKTWIEVVSTLNK